MDEGIAEQINTLNEWAVSAGTNMPNHTTTMRGRGKFIKLSKSDPVILRTKQEAYRLAAYILIMAELQDLPNEDGAHTLEQITNAICNV